MSIRDFLAEAEKSGLFADEELPRMRSMIATSKRTAKTVLYEEAVLEDTKDLLDRHYGAISRHPELEAYLLERVANDEVRLDQERKRLAPDIAKQKRKEMDHGVSDSEFLSDMSRLSALKPKPMAAF
jgi:hypothetical protein